MEEISTRCCKEVVSLRDFGVWGKLLPGGLSLTPRLLKYHKPWGDYSQIIVLWTATKRRELPCKMEVDMTQNHEGRDDSDWSPFGGVYCRFRSVIPNSGHRISGIWLREGLLGVACKMGNKNLFRNGTSRNFECPHFLYEPGLQRIKWCQKKCFGILLPRIVSFSFENFYDPIWPGADRILVQTLQKSYFHKIP